MKLPDVGEGVAEAELVAWLVEVGDEVTPDTVARRGAHRQGDGRDLVAGRRHRDRRCTASPATCWRSAAT